MSANRLAVDLTVRFPDFTLAVERTFTLGGITALFGPSGSGKSTLLRAIAGFERTGIGRIALDEEAWLDSTARLFVPAHRPPVGFMF